MNVRLAVAVAVSACTCAAAHGHAGAGIVVDARGQVYFVHGVTSRIMRIDTDGHLSTFVQGTDGGKLSTPHHLVLDTKGNLWSAGDRDGHLWKIAPDATTTLAYPPLGGSGVGFLGAGGDPFTIDDAENIYFVNSRQFAYTQLLRSRPDGRLAVVAGGDWGFADGPATTARFRDLHGAAMRLARDGALLLTDGGTCVRRVAPDGTVSTVAGGAEGGFADGPAKSARFLGACGLAIEVDDSILVADAGNRRVRRIAPDGTVSTIAGSGRRGDADGSALSATFDTPAGVAVGPDGTIFVLDFHDDDPRVRRIGRDGMVTTIAVTDSHAR
ncbi:MAG: hypothetical protein U0575_07500 [Phycisphaerales bacterium]